MAQVRFISDLHFNHINMAHTRGFETANLMNEHIIEKWNSVVNKKDITYILGDITMERKDGYELLDLLNGLKYVILGNHDRRQDIPALMEYVHSVAGMIDYKKYAILSHAPIHPNELDYRFHVNIHGHVHENTIMEKYWCNLDEVDKERPHPNYINVSAEVIDYTPKLLIELCPNYKKEEKDGKN
jgi:calcineurin-like phosphoesterase family protein